jgi:hypothetical protein
MITPARIENVKDNNIIPMNQMEPLQVAVVVSSGAIVMRTASTQHFEVMNLTASEPSRCWTGYPSIHVRLLPSGTKISFEVV